MVRVLKTYLHIVYEPEWAEQNSYTNKPSQRYSRTTLFWTRASLHSAHIEIYSIRYTTIIIAKQHNKLTFCPYFVLRRLSEWKAIRCEPRRYPHATRFRILRQAFGTVVCCASANYHIHVIPSDIQPRKSRSEMQYSVRKSVQIIRNFKHRGPMLTATKFTRLTLFSLPKEVVIQQCKFNDTGPILKRQNRKT